MPDIDIQGWILQLSIMAIPFLTAITFHEAAHGYVAYKLGDPTAKAMGRLTLNPLKHLDLMGTLVLVITRFIGWAKPVPVDARYFKDPQRGMLYVALAGPVSNFLVALAFGMGFRVWAMANGLPARAVMNVWYQVLMQPTADLLGSILAFGLLINLALAFFNLIPIPPLDGANILAGLLPRKAAMRFMSLGRYGFLLVILLAALGLLGEILMPLIRVAVEIIL